MPVKRKNADEVTAPPSGVDLGIPFDQIRALIDLLEERGLEEFELEREGVRIRIKRRGAPAAPAPVFASYAPPANSPAPAGETASSVGGEEEAGEAHVIKSPIVGTFYAAPRPDAPPFVGLGDVVDVGQVLCIVEAMKLMNEIEADVAGEIVRIYGENGQPVEYGEPLFAVRPSKKR